MKRRNFLRLAGVGGALAVVAPKLVVPPVTTSLAVPERTFFLPPSTGWLPGESALPYVPLDMPVYTGDGSLRWSFSGYYNPDFHLQPGDEVELQFHGNRLLGIVTDTRVDMFAAGPVSIGASGIGHSAAPSADRRVIDLSKYAREVNISRDIRTWRSVNGVDFRQFRRW